jgi:dihydroxy-acid dehydratase
MPELLTEASCARPAWAKTISSKPFIAICNSYIDIIPGHVHLNEVGQYVKECVRAAGGVPFVFNTIGVDDGIAMGHAGMKFSLPSREIIADSVETMINAHCFDGMICIPNCDKIVPGMLMAPCAATFPPSSSAAGRWKPARPSTADGRPDRRVLSRPPEAKRRTRFGRRTLELEKIGCPTCGSCSGMFTANSMNCLCEALGWRCRPTARCWRPAPNARSFTAEAPKRIVEMVLEFDKVGEGHGLLPREIVTQDSVDNAMILDMAMGGSTNTVLHTLAIAHEAGLDYDMERINELSQKTPNICKVSPSSHYHVEDVHNSGGIHTILGSIKRAPGLLKTGRLPHRHRQDARRKHRRVRRSRRDRRGRKYWSLAAVTGQG